MRFAPSKDRTSRRRPHELRRKAALAQNLRRKVDVARDFRADQAA